MRLRAATAVCSAFLVAFLVGRASAQCPGDCGGNSVVELSEVVTCVNIGLGTQPLNECPNCSADGRSVQVTDLIEAVANSMGSCPPTPTPTSTATITPTPSPTPTGTQACPVEAGQYTLTQTEGGELTVSTIPTFPFPSGGTIVMDVGAADFPECKHPVTIANPGGFNAPVFCIVALGFTVDVAQTGCGIGELDSNGGSDYTVREIGDTSDAGCGFTQACAAAQDSKARVDITVGDGQADQCTTGTANLITSIPVFTTTWSRVGAPCPDADGTYNPGTDTLIVSFPQTLDFTSDTTIADFADLDGDGCCIAGAGPATGTIVNCNEGGGGPLSGGGTCLDLQGGTITTAASGPVGSNGAPLYDLAFLTVLPNTFAQTGEFGDIQCADPPIIPIGVNAGTTQSRCVAG
jgi:hypothetical protein